MKDLSELDMKTPQQIRMENERKKQAALEYDLRTRFLAEYRYQSLSKEKKHALKKIALHLMGYDSSIEMRENDMLIRVIYHKPINELYRDQNVLSIFVRLEDKIDMLCGYLKTPLAKKYEELESELKFSKTKIFKSKVHN